MMLKKIPTPTLVDGIHLAGYAMVLSFLIAGFVVAARGQEAFLEFLKEDGLVEYLTFLFLLAPAVLAMVQAVREAGQNRLYPVITWILLALLFLFAAGEEISWGQRIFGIETPDFFLEKNLQKETNFHNLVVGGVKINKLVFSQLLTAGMVLYFIFLPLLVRNSKFFRLTVAKFALPVPCWHHILAMIIAVVLASQYNLMKAAELRELAFATVLFLVILRYVGVRGSHTPGL